MLRLSKALPQSLVPFFQCTKKEMPTGKCTQRVFCRPFFFLLQLHSKANCKEETFAAATTPPTSFSIFILYQMHFLLLLCQRTNEATSGAGGATFAPWQTILQSNTISIELYNVLNYYKKSHITILSFTNITRIVI